jgi:2-succinyl-6-hydroxy-2,4-cyclohexadiene-1-carboxylate synthase
MLINSEIRLNIEPGIPSGEKEIIIFLHGFSGSLTEWREILPIISSTYDCITVDLIGHGLSDAPDSYFYYSSSAIVSQLHELINQLPVKNIILIGYSMGGRAALSFAVSYPGMIKALVLESTSPGIKNETDREARKRNDELLAEFIQQKGIKEFVNYWMNIDLFKNQKKLPGDKLQEQLKEKLKNNKIGLVNSLIGFGTGVMPHLYDELNKLNFPVLLITGENDVKFTKINSSIKSSFQNASHVIIKEAGHNIHFELPEIFASEVNLFLTSL